MTPAELEDLQWIANEEGWTLEEALYRIAWQQGFGRFVQELRETYSDEYAGGGILGDEGPRNVFVAFRNAVPQEVRDDPRLQYLDVEFREGTGFGEAELIEQATEAHYAMVDSGFTEVSSGPDIQTGVIRIEAVRRPIDRDKTAAEIITSLPSSLRADNIVIVFYPEGTVLGGDD